MPRCPPAGSLFDLGSPEGRARGRGQQEEEREDRHQFQHHRHGSKPGVVPHATLYLRLALLARETPQLEPSVVRERPQPSARDYDEGRRAHVRDQVEGQEDDQLDDLYEAPRLVDCGGRWLAEHLDGVWGIGEEDAMGRDDVDESFVDEGSLYLG